MPKSDTVQLHPPLLRRLMSAFPGGIAYLNRELVFTFCNEAQATYFGLSTQEVVGKHLQDVAPGRPPFCQAVERAVSSGQTQPQPFLTMTSDEAPELGERHYLVSCMPDLGNRGEVRGVFTTALDVTESIRRERETQDGLMERNASLEQTIRERDILLGIVSHEVRTPLTTISGNAHLLLQRLERLDEGARNRAISDIRSEAERLNHLVENMLLLARAGAQAPVPTETVLMENAIGKVVFDHNKRFNSRTITVSVKPRSLGAKAQPEYLGQVLQNLLGNAEKYSPTDQAIDIRARRRGPDVTVSVLDRGGGIDAAEAEIVFQPFYRSARTAATVSGAGIGLAVCKLLVQSQSGEISTHPRRGGGSVFIFSLPAAA